MSETKIADELFLNIWDGQDGWINFPLMNETGRANDYTLRNYNGHAKFTEYMDRCPNIKNLVLWLGAEGFDIEYVRVSVLAGRSVIRTHVDIYQSTRLLLALNESGTSFRHVIGNECLSMKAGELWTLKSSLCHGAANLDDSTRRLILLIDARPTSSVLPKWYSSGGADHHDHRVQRPTWNDEAREDYYSKLVPEALAGLVDSVEREWLLLPFERNVHPRKAYRELIRFCEQVASQSTTSNTREFWNTRAQYWHDHNCRCVSRS